MFPNRLFAALVVAVSVLFAPAPARAQTLDIGVYTDIVWDGGNVVIGYAEAWDNSDLGSCTHSDDYFSAQLLGPTGQEAISESVMPDSLTPNLPFEIGTWFINAQFSTFCDCANERVGASDDKSKYLARQPTSIFVISDGFWPTVPPEVYHRHRDYGIRDQFGVQMMFSGMEVTEDVTTIPTETPCIPAGQQPNTGGGTTGSDGQFVDDYIYTRNSPPFPCESRFTQVIRVNGAAVAQFSLTFTDYGVYIDGQ